ncbi:hypothetical protein [Limnoglobus roseus]|uniref:Uncharacterized protein n=1 Tax=Limnoglobus roseus TaxID=2598579 RepID=A0A5C1AG14_9BACT|nr:hypothetical protein [Limnoglobus roseus]QEL17565.1 hypothetical protein PX52LOC_04561 [Limnoglobus roseus]
MAYKHKIVGIHAPLSQRDELTRVYQLITSNKKYYQFCCAINGSQALIGKATAILKQDIENLPYPDAADKLDLAFWEQTIINDVMDHMVDYVRLGQDSELLTTTANAANLAAYSELFVRLLGSLYRGLHAHDPVFLNGLVAQPFYYGVRPDVSWLGVDCQEALHKLVYDTSRDVLRSVRVVRYYEENIILVVKPDRLRYWLPSTAIRDADDTLIELRDQGW